MRDVVTLLTVISISGWLAGTINPAVVGMVRTRRWKVFIIGLATSFLAVMSIGLTEPAESTSNASALLGLFSLVILCGWPIWALISLKRELYKRTVRDESIAKPWEGSHPQLLSKEQRKNIGLPSHTPIKQTPSINSAKKPPTRAIRTGWKLGTIEFSYEDANGEITQRTVTVHSVDSTYIKGECHSRRAERTFRIDRVLGDVVDVETGEIFSPMGLSRHFI